MANQAKVPHRPNATPPAVARVRPTPSLTSSAKVHQPATSSRSTSRYISPSGKPNRSVGGKKAPLCMSAAKGTPIPSYGFHQGTCPESQSEVTR